jgi:hypothetical protein
VSICAVVLRRGGEKTIPDRYRATIEEDTMNPNFNWAIVAERMQALQADAEKMTRARRARRLREAWAVAHVGQRHPGSTVRGITFKTGEAL